MRTAMQNVYEMYKSIAMLFYCWLPLSCHRVRVSLVSSDPVHRVPTSDPAPSPITDVLITFVTPSLRWLQQQVDMLLPLYWQSCQPCRRSGPMPTRHSRMLPARP